MKTSILALACAPLLLAACTQQDDEVATLADREAISFRPTMGALSRATEVTNANLPSVTVTALLGDKNYFTDLVFSNDNAGFYTSEKSYYWPGDNSTVNFYAYYPDAETLGADVTINNSTKEVANFSVNPEIADQVDFITATATGNKKDNEASGVPMQFKHRLAQIEIRAKSANTNYTYKVAGVRIGRAQYLGTYSFTDDKWTLDDWHDTEVYTSSCTPVTLSANPVNIMGDSGNAMLLPQTLVGWDPVGDPDNVAREAYLSVLINITSDTGVTVYPWPTDTKLDANGQKRQYAWASIPLSGTWEQGKKYIYTLDFTDGAGNVDPDDPNPGNVVLGDAIKVVPTVVDWEDSDTSIPMTPVKPNK